jgi:hypothetical protein
VVIEAQPRDELASADAGQWAGVDSNHRATDYEIGRSAPVPLWKAKSELPSCAQLGPDDRCSGHGWGHGFGRKGCGQPRGVVVLRDVVHVALRRLTLIPD